MFTTAGRVKGGQSGITSCTDVHEATPLLVVARSAKFTCSTVVFPVPGDASVGKTGASARQAQSSPAGGGGDVQPLDHNTVALTISTGRQRPLRGHFLVQASAMIPACLHTCIRVLQPRPYREQARDGHVKSNGEMFCHSCFMCKPDASRANQGRRGHGRENWRRCRVTV